MKVWLVCNFETCISKKKPWPRGIHVKVVNKRNGKQKKPDIYFENVGLIENSFKIPTFAYFDFPLQGNDWPAEKKDTREKIYQ